ncbi:LOW QUALITY PROTEIN: transmembrane protease serine 2-like [Lampetra planeri]
MKFLSQSPLTGVKPRWATFAVAAVTSLLLLLLVAGVLLAYYLSSSCVHGLRCGDGGCVWESQWCDGVRDCPGGQDEADCVRVHGSSFLLQIYWSQTRNWRSVCSHGWTELQGRASCRDIGYSRSTYFQSGRREAQSDDGFLTVTSDVNPDAPILQQLVFSKTCPNNAVVTLQCTDCGRGVNSSRASGDQPAPLGSWPWQVSLQMSGSHRCGGAVVSPYWIVTTAHCVSASRPEDWAVYAGVVDPLGTLFNPAYPVSRVIAHEGFDRRSRKNDIALMRLGKRLDIAGTVGPVCLPNVGLNITAPQTCWTTGFNRTMNGGGAVTWGHRGQDRLLTFPILDSSDCNSSAVYEGRISQDMLCAGGTTAGPPPCHAADGAALLVTLTHGKWWLVGVNVWGQRCHEQHTPAVYGNVTYFLDWMFRQMKVTPTEPR